jgi:hypothetical protein
MRAFLIGLLAASSLIVGAAIALIHPVRRSLLGLIMAFGSGVLIGAVAYDLVAGAFATSRAAGIPLGLLAGSLAFFFRDLATDRWGCRAEVFDSGYTGVRPRDRARNHPRWGARVDRDQACLCSPETG